MSRLIPHSLKLTVSDGQQEATCTTTVTVQDTTAPVVACSLATPSLWPPQHDLLDVGLGVSAIDACEASLTVQVAVVSDEDDQQASGAARASRRTRRASPRGRCGCGRRGRRAATAACISSPPAQ